MHREFGLIDFPGESDQPWYESTQTPCYPDFCLQCVGVFISPAVYTFSFATDEYAMFNLTMCTHLGACRTPYEVGSGTDKSVQELTRRDRPFPFQGVLYTSRPPSFCCAWGVQLAKREED